MWYSNFSEVFWTEMILRTNGFKSRQLHLCKYLKLHNQTQLILWLSRDGDLRRKCENVVTWGRSHRQKYSFSLMFLWTSPFLTPSNNFIYPRHKWTNQSYQHQHVAFFCSWTFRPLSIHLLVFTCTFDLFIKY